MNFKEIMEFNEPYNQLYIDSLIKDIQSNKIVPYIGAGMSILFKDIYPSWAEFLNKTFEKFGDIERNEFNELSYEDKATYLSNEIGKGTFATYLKDVFAKEHLNKYRSEISDKAIFLLPTIFDKGLIMTTNYDKVIESVYSLHNEFIPPSHPGHFEALNGAIREDNLLLYKIHGDIDEPIDSIILTKNQYDIAYENPQLIETLKQIYISKSILFLGCSLEKDRPIELLCEVSKSGMNNYAIISCDSENKKIRRLELDNEYYTKAIIYPSGKHECVKIILDYISKIVNMDTYKNITKNNFNNNYLSLNMDEQWFANQNKIQIKNLGDRYLPDLNIDLNEKKIFDAIGRNKEFYKKYIKKSDELLILLKDLNLLSIDRNINNIFNIIESFSIDTIKDINIKSLNKDLEDIDEILSQEIKSIYNISEKEQINKQKYKDRIYKLKRAENLIYEYKNYINSNEIKVVNNPFLLLDGEGGIGKSHLLAEMITKRNSEGKKSLLFLGHHFKENNNPLNEILKMLELNCTTNEFLRIINTIAENDKSRIIIFIDALNEGLGSEIWKNHLSGIIEKIKLYPWIGVVLSIRTEYVENLLDNNDYLKNSLVNITHKGFSDIEYSAIKKYFDFYNIPYSDIPFTNQEFRNPLFLRLLCEGFKNNRIDLDNISFVQIYKNYLSSINKGISETCGYSRRINIVEKVIIKLVEYKYNKGKGNNLILLDEAIDIIIDIEKKYNTKPLLDELISNGIITQSINYNSKEYIHITYEKLEDYIYAQLLEEELKNIGENKFSSKYINLLRRRDKLEALAVVLSENGKYELFELFKEEEENSNIIKAFCDTLRWRNSSSISQKTLDYINNIVLSYEYGFENLYESLILISTKVSHRLNADCTVKNILQYKMPDRDANYIPLFDRFYLDEGSSINRLLDWSLFKTNFDNVQDETIRLSAIMIATFLISSNNLLRDKATKALVNLLNGHSDILIKVLRQFENIDDPYVLERLYAVVFGCIVSEESDAKIEKISMYVYDKIFKNEYVYPNILIRDYAKNIIEYAKYKLKNERIQLIDINFNYKSVFPEVPTDEEILRYEYDYNKSSFKDYFWSQLSIISSMQVEYSRNRSCGGYGNFGRYVFQRYFSNWKGLDYNDLKNIAIKKIFDMGYDVEKHGKYDRIVSNDRFRNQSRERIGKKYQWIALYELAAQIADHYKLEIHNDFYGESEETYCKSSFEPDIRNIDPTSLIISINSKEDNRKIHNNLYKIPSVINSKWLDNFNDIPNMNALISIEYENQEFILLNGGYTWTEEKKLGEKQFQNPQKDMWIQINSYVIESKSLDIIMNKLKNKDLMGRWLSEPKDNYHIYNKEYYWSEAHNFFRNPYYYGDEWCKIEKYEKIIDVDCKILLPTFKYSTERKGDSFNDNNVTSWYKPSMELFNKLNMRYGKSNSILYDSQGRIICFDSIELLKEDIGFFIDKKSFIKYLEENDYGIFWTMLSEKRIIGNLYNNYDEQFEQPSISKLYKLNEDRNLKEYI